MDLQVEKNYIREVQNNNLDKYIYLYDANVESVFAFVKRRVLDKKAVEKIVESVFFEGLSNIKKLKADVVFCVWLYSLAKEKVSTYIEENKLLKDVGVSLEENPNKESIEFCDKAKKIFNKLSFEERDILRLKFFEEVSDGDIGFILNQGSEAIGPRIYRVLKRTHFLLFGESDERQGIYFGELTGFISKLKDIEKVKITDLYKLNLRSNILKKIERKDVAIEVEEIKPKNKPKAKENTGSNDPAKIFVQAVKEMSEDERKSWSKGIPKVKRETDRSYNILSKWRYVFILIPFSIFIISMSFVLLKINDLLNNNCDYQVLYLDGLSEDEVVFVQEDFNKRLCETFDINYVMVGKIYNEKLLVRVDLYEYVYKYILVPRNDNWFIEKYEKHTYRHEEPGKIPRNS